jgi:hypothetical protein|tara:strand:- start:2572 stop:2796 length:225 start_codon:yes stop_codon:yes gene_type:complete
MFDFVILIFVMPYSGEFKYMIDSKYDAMSAMECVQEAEDYNASEPHGGFSFAACVPLFNPALAEPDELPDLLQD